MSSGFFALLDDVAAIAKAAAASVDDIAVQAGKASSKVAGIVIDDAAVTPKYVVGLTPDRELPIIGRIAMGSLKNKLFYLLPAALILGFFAPWGIAPLLMIGGLFLCFEGYEKAHHIMHAVLHPGKKAHAPESATPITPEELERARTQGAIRTDMILSAEIMAITYATVASEPVLTQFIVLLAVGVAITIAVYGFVALIVKMDDIGIHLSAPGNAAPVQALGRGLVAFMPVLLTFLTYVGTAAMLWVGCGIILHNIPALHHAVYELRHAVEAVTGNAGLLPWIAEVLVSILGGLMLGAATERGVHFLSPLAAKVKAAFRR